MIFIFNKQSPPLSQVFKSKVAGRFLFVRPDKVSWSISSDLRSGDKRYIKSGSAGLRCPASPESKFNERFNIEDWEFNMNANGEGGDFEKGGVVVSCITCGLSTAWGGIFAKEMKLIFKYTQWSQSNCPKYLFFFVCMVCLKPRETNLTWCFDSCKKDANSSEFSHAVYFCWNLWRLKSKIMVRMRWYESQGIQLD